MYFHDYLVKYEYNLLCHEKCPVNTYTIENEYLCLDKKPEGYYLYNNIEYKKCFETCSICDGKGTIEYNNCLKSILQLDVLKFLVLHVHLIIGIR